MQLMDDCSDLFIKVPELTNNQNNLQQRFQLVHSNVTEKSPIAILVTLVLSAVPHSMVVERAVSNYNIFRNDKRLAMSLQSVNDRLLVALNVVGTGNFDPRNAVAHFLGSKRRRYREPERVVKLRLADYLSTNNLLNSFQSAYIKHHST